MSSKKMIVGNSIIGQKFSWSFDSLDPRAFDAHIRQSIPGYDLGHELVLQISNFFCLPHSVCYDLGASTGTLTKKLAEHHFSIKPDIRWIAVEGVESMVNEAKRNTSGLKNVECIHADVRDIEFLRSDLIISYYFIQFIPPKDRQILIDRIYQSLNWGGAFVWFEKVRGPDARFQDMLNNLYVNFKLQEGFSPEEIINKSESLKSVLEPFSHQANLDLLNRAGFKDVMTIFRNICFEGLVCIK